ncbi:MAG: DUF86 domain-containing protein [Methanomicrobiaceae archaeon]|nr:DUF86 domain-containing protein [Methanomicrobiaceae archaeon]
MTGRDVTYLIHILEAITYIEDFSKTISSAAELKDHPLERAGIERMLTIIGEASKQISPAFKNEHPQIPWKEAAGMRDKIMHHYFGVDYEAVFETVQHDLPGLKKEISALVKSSETEEHTSPIEEDGTRQ